MLNPNQLIIKVIEGMGFRTAVFARVASDDGYRVRLVDSQIEYDSRGHDEIDPAIPGYRSYLVMFDDGEEEKVSGV